MSTGILNSPFGEIGAIALKGTPTPEGDAQLAAIEQAAAERALADLRALQAASVRSSEHKPDEDAMVVRGKAIGFTYAAIAHGDLEPTPDLMRVLAEQFREVALAFTHILPRFHPQNLATFASSVNLGAMQFVAGRVKRLEAELAELRQLVTTKKGK